MPPAVDENVPADSNSPAPISLEELRVADSPAQQVAADTGVATHTPVETPPSAVASEAKASGYEAAKGAVAPQQTVSSQLNDLLKTDSALSQRASTSGKLYAARRGLTNSSIASGAAMGAMADRMLPVASQDASTYHDAAMRNQAAENKAREFGSAAENASELQRAELETRTSMRNADAIKEGLFLNADLQNKISMSNADRKTAIAQGNAQEANKHASSCL